MLLCDKSRKIKLITREAIGEIAIRRSERDLEYNCWLVQERRRSHAPYKPQEYACWSCDGNLGSLARNERRSLAWPVPVPFELSRSFEARTTNKPYLTNRSRVFKRKTVELPPMRLCSLPTKELCLFGLCGCGLKTMLVVSPKAAQARFLGRFGAFGAWVRTFRTTNVDINYLSTLSRNRQRSLLI